MHNEDHDWLEGWSYDPPPLLVPSQPLTRTRINSPNRVGAWWKGHHTPTKTTYTTQTQEELWWWW